jgi:hypothetical protein
VNLADPERVVGDVLEDFVDEREVEVCAGKVDGFDVSDGYTPLGQSAQVFGCVDLLGAVFDSPGVCAEVRQRPDVLARAAPAVDCALAAQRSRDRRDLVEAFLQVERSSRVAARGLDLELRHLSRVIKLDVSLRLPPAACTSA